MTLAVNDRRVNLRCLIQSVISLWLVCESAWVGMIHCWKNISVNIRLYVRMYGVDLLVSEVCWILTQQPVNTLQ